MKANELMIGDWIYLIRDSSKVKDKWIINQVSPQRVIGIMTDTDNPSIQTTATDTYYGEDSYEPIPLTKEILEKNDIKWLSSEPSGRKTYCCNDPVINCTYIPDSGWWITVGAAGSIKVPFAEASMIQYVHQLQHLLRLIGSEKEIIL